jgi:hypothetical protein
MVIRILNHVPHGYSAHEGNVIANVLQKTLNGSDEPVEVSFKGVSDVPSSFINAALVSLLDTYSFEWVKSHVAFTDVTQQVADMIRRCLINGARAKGQV